MLKLGDNDHTAIMTGLSNTLLCISRDVYAKPMGENQQYSRTDSDEFTIVRIKDSEARYENLDSQPLLLKCFFHVSALISTIT